MMGMKVYCVELESDSYVSDSLESDSYDTKFIVEIKVEGRN